MKFVCITCKKEWISDIDRAGQPYECPLCERERIHKERPSGTANSRKAINKNIHKKYNTKK